MSGTIPGKLAAIIHLGNISKASTGPTRVIGQQCYMEGMSGVLYVTKEAAAQWLPILTEIANEKSTNA